MPEEGVEVILWNFFIHILQTRYGRRFANKENTGYIMEGISKVLKIGKGIFFDFFITFAIAFMETL